MQRSYFLALAGLVFGCFSGEILAKNQNEIRKISKTKHQQTFADEYQPELGSGVNYSETKTYRTCINQVELESTPLALNRLYKETRVNSREELLKTLSVSASVSAKGVWGGAEAELSYFNEMTMSDEAFYWLVDAHYAVTSEKVKTNGSFDLSEQAKSILRNEGLRAFYQACGTHFYSGRRLGGRYTLVYEFNSQQDKVVKRLKARASYHNFGLQAQAEFSRFLQLASQAAILKIHTRIAGGGDAIKNYTKDPEKLEEELAHLRRDLLQERRGVVLQWYMNSYDIFEEVLRRKREENYETVDDAFREDALSYYYYLYSANLKISASIRASLVAAAQEEPYVVYSAEKRALLQQILRQYERQNQLIQHEAKLCLRGASACPTAELLPLGLDLPQPDKDLSGLGNWVVYPVILDRNTQMSRISFSAQPAGPYAARLFDTRGLVYASEFTAFTILPADASAKAQAEAFAIGNIDMIIDPNTGKARPALCLGAFGSQGQGDHTCNLRIIENPTVLMDDGYPAAKMQLTLFDELGFIKGANTFYIKP